MKRARRRMILTLSLAALMCGCTDDIVPEKDPQYLGLYYRYNYRDVVDTFTGTLTKDLIADGTATVGFWLTTEAQDSILAEAVRDSFFAMPDTIIPPVRIAIYPFPPPQVLRIRAGELSHQVVWYNYPGGDAMTRLAGVILGIVQSTPEYKSLPPARGEYM